MLPRDAYISTAALRILQKLNTEWTESDGLCQRCYEAAQDTACELEDIEAEQGCVSGFTQYYRYHLTSREHRLWNHASVYLAEYHRANVDDKVAREARAAGYDAWLVFGPDETLLAQGCYTGEQATED